MADSSSPTIEVNLGPGGLLGLGNASDLKKWITDERAAWQWIPPGPLSNELKNQHASVLRELDSQEAYWRNNPQSDGALVLSEKLNAISKPYFVDQLIFASTSPNAIFIFEIKTKYGPDAALVSYLMLLDRLSVNSRPREPLTPQVVEAILKTFLYKNEISFTATAHAKALEELKLYAEKKLVVREQAFDLLQTKTNKLLDENSKTLDKWKTLYASLQDTQKTTFEDLIKKHEEKLGTIEDTYNQKLALQKPVEYWQVKERHHSFWAKVFGGISLVAVSISIYSLNFLLKEVLSVLKDGSEPGHIQIGVLIVGAFFAVWMVRIFVRLLFSNLHLSTDAAERRTMILTYLAMSREGSNFGPDDKKLIIQHLFRAASDGLVKDDAAPPGFLEVITRR